MVDKDLDERIEVYVSKELLDRVTAIAEHRDVSISSVVRECLEMHYSLIDNIVDSTMAHVRFHGRERGQDRRARHVKDGMQD
jgi:hypothetical protein